MFKAKFCLEQNVQGKIFVTSCLEQNVQGKILP